MQFSTLKNKMLTARDAAGRKKTGFFVDKLLFSL